MQKLTLVPITCLALLCGATPDTQPAERFRINLSPPAHVGDRFRLASLDTQAMHSVVRISGEQPVQNASYNGVDLDSTINVQAIDPKGRPAKMELMINYLVPYYGGVDPYVDGGTVIVAQRGHSPENASQQKDSFTLKDGPLNPAQSLAMGRVLTIGDEKDATEQELFGIDKPITIGETWPLNAETARKLFARMQIKVDPAHAAGSGKLVGTFQQLYGPDYFDVEIEVRCDQYQPDVPKNQNLVSGRATGLLRLYIARDGGMVIDSKYYAHTEIEVSGVNQGKPYTCEQSVDNTRSQRTRVVDK